MADLAHIRDKMEKIRNQLSGLPVFTIGLLRSRSAIRERPGFGRCFRLAMFRKCGPLMDSDGQYRLWACPRCGTRIGDPW
jgi:hypothetical protein